MATIIDIENQIEELNQEIDTLVSEIAVIVERYGASRKGRKAKICSINMLPEPERTDYFTIRTMREQIETARHKKTLLLGDKMVLEEEENSAGNDNANGYIIIKEPLSSVNNYINHDSYYGYFKSYRKAINKLVELYNKDKEKSKLLAPKDGKLHCVLYDSFKYTYHYGQDVVYQIIKLVEED